MRMGGFGKNTRMGIELEVGGHSFDYTRIVPICICEKRRICSEDNVLTNIGSQQAIRLQN